MATKTGSKWRLLGEIITVVGGFVLFYAGFSRLFYHIGAGFTAEAVAALAENRSLIFVPALLSLPFATLATVGVMAFLLRRRGMKITELGLGVPQSWPKVLVQGVALAAGVYLVVSAVLAVLAHFGYTPRTEAFARIGESFVLYLFSVTAVAWVSAGFCEEVLFRGFLMRNLKDIFGGGKGAWALAVVLQAAVFGALHVSQGVAGVAAVTALALVFGAAYLMLGRSLWPLIVAHGLWNTVGFTLFHLGVG